MVTRHLWALLIPRRLRALLIARHLRILLIPRRLWALLIARHLRALLIARRLRALLIALRLRHLLCSRRLRLHGLLRRCRCRGFSLLLLGRRFRLHLLHVFERHRRSAAIDGGSADRTSASGDPALSVFDLMASYTIANQYAGAAFVQHTYLHAQALFLVHCHCL